MPDTLPHASFIGFTGTPIELQYDNTRAVFGNYLSGYDIQRGVEALAGSYNRLEVVTREIVEYFKGRLNSMDGKAMVVCMSRRICVVLLHRIVELRPDWAGDEEDRVPIHAVMTGSASVGSQPDGLCVMRGSHS